MPYVNRRTALMMGALATAPGIVLAQGKPEEEGKSEEQPSNGQDRAAGESAVTFWHDVSLELNAFDHSFVGDDAADRQRAGGPTASARALAVIHAVMADAVATVVPGVAFKAAFSKAAPTTVAFPDIFIGGAAAAICAFIYPSSEHIDFLLPLEAEFLSRFSPPSGGPADKLEEHERILEKTWEDGRDFALATEFQNLWDGPAIRESTDPEATIYQPMEGKHDVDPLNCNQGFYGQTFGLGIKALVLSENQVRTFCPPPPAPTSPEFMAALADVRDRGELMGDSRNPERTDLQTDSGVFWAYDGARFIGTPPRLYNQIIMKIARADGLDMPQLARLLALCNIAMSDSGNVAWFAKFDFAVWRPILGIRAQADSAGWKPLGSPRTNRLPPAPDFRFQVAAAPSGAGRARGDTVQDALLGGRRSSNDASDFRSRADADAGTCDTSDPAYSDAAFTPNFPAYPSGHATFGAAGFDMLSRVRGERISTPDGIEPAVEIISDELNRVSTENFQAGRRPVTVRQFATISAMIRDNNESRVHLGVHWLFDSTSGETAGKSVAEAVHKAIYALT